MIGRRGEWPTVLREIILHFLVLRVVSFGVLEILHRHARAEHTDEALCEAYACALWCALWCARGRAEAEELRGDTELPAEASLHVGLVELARVLLHALADAKGLVKREEERHLGRRPARLRL